MKVCRRETFNAAHRLFNPTFDDAKNQAVFGKCNNPNYHGHNYALLVCVDGPIDPETGYVIDLKILADIIDEEVHTPFDHKNLNLDCPEFENKMVSTENFAWIIYFILKEKLSKRLKLKVVLYETERNFVEVEE
jgi:6-pyruvoyltetrahydropterin/6-carboxytetrahydropterin synthase